LLRNALETLGKFISLRNVILKILMEYNYILNQRVVDHECRSFLTGVSTEIATRDPKDFMFLFSECPFALPDSPLGKKNKV
jgi:hypothetical protein